jgi:periplasmic divalent cation tolerance protein
VNEFVAVFCTAAPQDADKIAETLVNERLAACVNIAPIRFCYIWEGKLNLDREELLMIKTQKSQIETLKKRILQLHSYALPEIIALPIIDGHQPYLYWIAQSTSIG